MLPRTPSQVLNPRVTIGTAAFRIQATELFKQVFEHYLLVLEHDRPPTLDEVEEIRDDVILEWEMFIGERFPRGSTRKPRKNRQALTQAVRRRVFERDAYRCVRCEGYIALQIDHIKPVSKGGTNDDDNLQTLCSACNLSKGADYDGD